MKTILVTRPAPNGLSLCDAIHARGGKAHYFPVINIEPRMDDSSKACLSAIDTFDIIIFISPNAVLYSIEHIMGETSVAAVGKGTANTLKQHGMETHICPKENFSSEALLAEDAMAFVQGKKILIVRGEGGKTLLADTLSERGAQVSHAIVYERRLPNLPEDALGTLLRNKHIDVIVCTSVEGLQNLVALTAEKDRNILFSHELLVTSPALLSLAPTLGFKPPPILTANAQNETILISLFSE